MFNANVVVIAGLIASVSAHLKMTEPKPFTGLPNNSPLDAGGADFPCKFTGSYTAGESPVNTYGLGSQQTLSFVGSAVHGGGSCQVVLTYDKNPTKDSVWKVIHSIQGGCPVKDKSDNYPEDPNFIDPYTYPYTIPEDLPTGEATIGWTWFNRIGNREFYMNCGRVELTGKGGDKADFDKLPDMVVLNIEGKPTTTENYDIVFKDAGSSVENNIKSFGAQLCGNDGCESPQEDGSKVVGDSGNSGSSAAPAPSAPQATSAAPYPSNTQAASGAGDGGVFITTPSGGSAPTTSAAAEAPTSTAAAEVPPTTTAAADPPASTPSGNPGSGSGETSPGSPCSSEGTFVCHSTSYQQCASGAWSAVMQVAPGTTCEAGQGTQLNIAAAKEKRRGISFRA
ncbi:lytic polysaccharide monooxygenase [Xylariaceae sp. FL0662B]|nr:lytic polysaccharide monooxygenase [Xylariaceae sp. FL0662B]